VYLEIRVRNNTKAHSSFVRSFQSLKINLKPVGASTFRRLYDPFDVKGNIFLIYQTKGDLKKIQNGIYLEPIEDF
jgi:hypothetical protein